MDFTVLCKLSPPRRRFFTKTLLIMRFTAVLILYACLQVSAKGYGQVTLSETNTPLKEVFKKIQKQTGVDFLYNADLLKQAGNVTVRLNNVSLQQAVEECLKGKGLDYEIQSKTVIIKKKIASPPAFPPALPATSLPIEIRGRITDSVGNPLVGASITVKGTKRGTSSDANGNFTLNDLDENALVIVSFTGYSSRQIHIGQERFVNIKLFASISAMDQIQIIAYGTTTRRLNTGSVTTVTAETIEQQPVANPIAALEGRVPGMIVTQTTGVPGGAFNVQIRGRTSLDPSLTNDQPLYIIDGVPFAPPNNFINQMESSLGTPGNQQNLTHPGGASPFNSINPQDIESIEVLKDADATAIYGSRGASGVILITTKKGKVGKTELHMNVYTGISNVTRTMKMMNTQQYLGVRGEAFANDSVAPDPDNAFDLLVYDTTRYTDFSKLLIGGTAHTTDAQASVSGGSANTQFLLSSSYHHESTVFPGDLGDNRGTMHFNLTHTSTDKRLNINFSTIYSSDKNNLLLSDLTSDITLPPNLKLYDANGKLAWNEGGTVYFDNPLAYLNETYSAQTDNLLSNLFISYSILPKLTFRVNGGYNSITNNEQSAYPSTAQNPAYEPYLYSEFASSTFKSWILEPQLEFNTNISKGKLNILAGATVRDQWASGFDTEGAGYASDALLGDLAGASQITASRTYSDYKYNAAFGRITYNWDNKYLINLSGRRDGSSRFGPSNQYANFGSVGAAWIFSNESFFKNGFPVISFGKLRGSYGTTGNDKIPDYQYLDTWQPSTLTYQDSSGYTPNKLFNPNYQWERTRKLELAIELGFLRDRIMLSVDYYRNRSSNQLVQYKLPYSTGFTGVIENFPAVVQNSGVEMTINSTNIKSGNFSWSTTLTLTVPRNKLVSFPGLSTSSYKNTYIIGKPLNAIYGYQYLGVNPTTGYYLLNDVNHDGKLTAAGDFVYSGTIDPDYYGGLLNTFHYRSFQLDIFFEYRKQQGYNYLESLAAQPGTLSNLPVAMLNSWKKPGDIKPVRKYSQTYLDMAYNEISDLTLQTNNGVYGDASFIRLKNIALSYGLPTNWLAKVHMTSGRIYVQGQNLLTITHYLGGDPETQNFRRLPPLKTIAAGVQFNF